MAFFTINSRKHGQITFHASDDGGYVRVTGNGWDHKQPCSGGGFAGSTLTADESTLETVARRWWRQFLAGQRQFQAY